VSTVLDVDEDMQKLLFFSTTEGHSSKEIISARKIHLDFQFVANELSIFKSRDDIELLFDLYVVKNPSILQVFC
jgi:hypothetical protein